MRMGGASRPTGKGSLNGKNKPSGNNNEDPNKKPGTYLKPAVGNQSGTQTQDGLTMLIVCRE